MSKGTVYDPSLIGTRYASGTGNDELASLTMYRGQNEPALTMTFPLNPDEIQFSFQVKVAQTPTVGGMVVQIYGIQYSDLVMKGSFGGHAKGEVRREAFFEGMARLIFEQSLAYSNTPQPAHFKFPLLGYDMLVYVKDFTSPQGQLMVWDNALVNYEWAMTLFVETDNNALQTQKVATDEFLSAIASGLGFTANAYNEPINQSNQAQKLINANGGSLASFASAYYSGGIQYPGTNTPTASTASNAGAAGSASQSTAPVPAALVKNIQNSNDWAIAQLQYMQFPVTQSNVDFLVGWYGHEGGNWTNPDKYNPLNTKQPMPGSYSPGGTGIQAYTSWAQGIQATSIAMNNGFYPNILAALAAGNASQVDQSGGLASDLSTWSGGGYTQITPATGQST